MVVLSYLILARAFVAMTLVECRRCWADSHTGGVPTPPLAAQIALLTPEVAHNSKWRSPMTACVSQHSARIAAAMQQPSVPAPSSSTRLPKKLVSFGRNATQNGRLTRTQAATFEPELPTIVQPLPPGAPERLQIEGAPTGGNRPSHAATGSEDGSPSAALGATRSEADLLLGAAHRMDALAANAQPRGLKRPREALSFAAKSQGQLGDRLTLLAEAGSGTAGLQGHQAPASEAMLQCDDGRQYPLRLTCKKGDIPLNDYVDKALDPKALYVIEYVLDERRHGGGRQLMVKWEGYELDPYDWTAASNLENTAALAKWEKRQRRHG